MSPWRQRPAGSWLSCTEAVDQGGKQFGLLVGLKGLDESGGRPQGCASGFQVLGAAAAKRQLIGLDYRPVVLEQLPQLGQRFAEVLVIHFETHNRLFQSK